MSVECGIATVSKTNLPQCRKKLLTSPLGKLKRDDLTIFMSCNSSKNFMSVSNSNCRDPQHYFPVTKQLTKPFPFQNCQNSDPNSIPTNSLKKILTRAMTVGLFLTQANKCTSEMIL